MPKCRSQFEELRDFCTYTRGKVFRYNQKILWNFWSTVENFSAAQWLKYGDTGPQIFTTGRQCCHCRPVYTYFRPWTSGHSVPWEQNQNKRPPFRVHVTVCDGDYEERPQFANYCSSRTQTLFANMFNWKKNRTSATPCQNMEHGSFFHSIPIFPSIP